jgi:ubiquinone/menaquinone biosynthesis C-methylase UbiE
MASIDENRAIWNGDYDWTGQGEEWSEPWGGSESQWRWTFLPRIGAYVPAARILEIAPGFGRWTRFLKDLCQHLTVVDMSDRCIQACRQRFAAETHITYHTNDGKSLAMVPDGSIDFAFSADSLVHAEGDAIEAYLHGLARVLSPDGVAFIHHSNLGAYRRYYSLTTRIPRMGRAKYLLVRSGLVDPDHWRGLSMSASLFARYAREAGLQCIGQEIVNWGKSRRMIDSFSVVTRPTSKAARAHTVVLNPNFMKEAEQVARSSRLYTPAATAPADTRRLIGPEARPGRG